MTIEFRCPNGHRLSCPDEMAGRSAKCPKCATVVRIPEAGSTIQSASDSGVAMPSVSDSNADHGDAGGDAAEGATQEQQSAAPAKSSQTTIVFLCPNEHRLTAPVALQGKPGKCPHCGAKFLVPMLDQEEENEAASGSATGIENFMEDSETEGDASGDAAEDEVAGMHFDLEELGFSDDEDDEQEDVDAAARDMSKLFVQLWRQRTDQTEVEIQLKGGQVYKPHWYAPSLSRRSYGMFATEDANQSYALTVIAWSAIDRISLRGLDGLPQDVFEG